jgi:hypothetical protein
MVVIRGIVYRCKLIRDRCIKISKSGDLIFWMTQKFFYVQPDVGKKSIST